MLLSFNQACSYPMRAMHAKYGSFAYSSAYAYSLLTGLFSPEQYALASQLGLSEDGEGYRKMRNKSECAVTKLCDGNPFLVSVWRPF